MKKELLKELIESIDDGVDVSRQEETDKGTLVWFYYVNGIDNETNTTWTITIDDERLEYLGLKVDRIVDNITGKILKVL